MAKQREVALKAIEAVVLPEGWPKAHPSFSRWQLSNVHDGLVLRMSALGAAAPGCIDVSLSGVTIRCGPEQVQAAIEHAFAWHYGDEKGAPGA